MEYFEAPAVPELPIVDDQSCFPFCFGVGPEVPDIDVQSCCFPCCFGVGPVSEKLELHDPLDDMDDSGSSPVPGVSSKPKPGKKKLNCISP